VRLDGSERSDELFRSHLATRYVDPAAIRSPGAAAASRRHPFFRSTPHITYWAVLLHHIRVGSGHNEAMASAATNYVDFAVNGGGVRVVLSHRLRPAALALVRGRVKNPHGGVDKRWPDEREVGGLGTCNCGSGDDHVKLAIRSGYGRMVGRPRHSFFLSPFVGSRVILVVDAGSLAFVPAANHVHFAVEGGTVELFIRLRERRRLLPRRCWYLTSVVTRRGYCENEADDQSKHRGPQLQYFYFRSFLSS